MKLISETGTETEGQAGISAHPKPRFDKIGVVIRSAARAPEYVVELIR